MTSSSSSANQLVVERTGELEITMTREFDAPRELVYRLWVDPAKLPEFWGPRRMQTRVDTWDLRPGGAWRMVNIDGDGTEYGFRGEFREIVPGESITWTFEFEGAPGEIAVETVTFESLEGGRTRMRTTSTGTSREGVDAMIESGMEQGAGEMMERFDELLAREQA
jgi:uncharacterized protein YndB with AHSA1/START domain